MKRGAAAVTGTVAGAVTAVVLTVALAGGWHARRPSRSAAVPVSHAFRAYLASPQMRMVAYAPTPEADARSIDAALTVLRGRFDGLSLYGCTSQTVQAVDAAERLHYKAVLVTVWDPRAEAELAVASSLVRDHAGTMAMAVSLGSEGLMQGRYALADVEAARAELLDRNRAPASVEMTTTEPWWLYVKPENGALRRFGEFAAVNVHVVWDTDIRNAALAASWTRDRTAEVRRAGGMPVLLRESGFPGGGNSPRADEPRPFDRTMQAEYWKAWEALPERPAAAVFEGVDNPAKHWRGFEGTWGLLREDLTPWPAWEAFGAVSAVR